MPRKIKVSSIEERLGQGKKEVLVEIRNMNVIFGKKRHQNHAVNNLNLNIYKGEVLGLVGESGSGKSTTGNAIIGLIDRTDGEIKIKGESIPAKMKNIKSDKRKFLVNTVQMIFQDPASSLNPYKNIYSIVSEGLKNVDVKQVFAKTFDGVSLTNLKAILKDRRYPKILDQLTLRWINEEIEAKKIDDVVRIIYHDVVEKLEKINSSYAREAIDYLKMRESVRHELMHSANSDKIIEQRLVSLVMKSVGLSDDIFWRYPLEFSGGQQQRIGISRAVVLKPELIIADEPISALDVSIQAQVVNIFNQLKKDLNLTILFIAHDLRMVEYISDRIAVMYKGKLLEIGEASEIVKNPVHPYTKTLISSVPTIDEVNVSLRSEKYDPTIHGYNENKKPSWYKVGSKEHYVIGTLEEVEMWANGGKNE